VLFTVPPSLSFARVSPFCRQPKQSLLHIRLWSMNGKFISYHHNTVIGLALTSKWVSRFGGGGAPPILTSLYPNIGQRVKVFVLPYGYWLLCLLLAPKWLTRPYTGHCASDYVWATAALRHVASICAHRYIEIKNWITPESELSLEAQSYCHGYKAWTARDLCFLLPQATPLPPPHTHT
jgi:hypothetical protein